MTFKANFNYAPSKRTKTATTYEDGTPLYSEKRTPGTAKAEEVLKSAFRLDAKTQKPVMLTPPRRFNGGLR